MLARYMLSSSQSLCLSVCLSQVNSVYLTLCYTGIRVSSKILLLPSRSLTQTLDSQVHVDRQCDKLVMVVGHQFITLSDHFVYNTMGVRQRVARVCLRQLRLVLVIIFSIVRYLANL